MITTSQKLGFAVLDYIFWLDVLSRVGKSKAFDILAEIFLNQLA